MSGNSFHRRCRNAAAQELLHETLIGCAWGVVIAGAIGAGIALFVHWPEILFEIRLHAILKEIGR